MWGLPIRTEHGLPSRRSACWSILASGSLIQPGQPNRSMSRIFEALQRAQQARSGKVQPMHRLRTRLKHPTGGKAAAGRLIFPYTCMATDQAKTLPRRSAHAEREREWRLAAAERAGAQGTNNTAHQSMTQQETDCRVVHLGTRHSRTIETGVVFLGNESRILASARPRKKIPQRDGM